MTIATVWNWTEVSALAASIGVIVAIFLHIRSLRHTWLSNSAKMVLDLINSFDSNDIRIHRRIFANALLHEKNKMDLSKDYVALQFLEEIGYMTRRRILDKGMVWNSFFWYIEPYYLALRENPDLIAAVRQQEQSRTVYREIEWLFRELSMVSVKEDGLSEYIPISKEKITKRLLDECALVVIDNS